MKLKAEIKVMQQKPPKTASKPPRVRREAWNRSFTGIFTLTLHSGHLASSTETSLCRGSHPVCSVLLQQPQLTNRVPVTASLHVRNRKSREF